MQGDFILHQRIFGPKRDTWVYHYEIFRGKNFELLILDVMREEVDGIALAKGIRERCVKSLESFFIFAFVVFQFKLDFILTSQPTNGTG